MIRSLYRGATWLAAPLLRRHLAQRLPRGKEEAERRIVVCFWHGRLMMMPFARGGSRPCAVMISGHRDGL